MLHTLIYESAYIQPTPVYESADRFYYNLIVFVYPYKPQLYSPYFMLVIGLLKYLFFSSSTPEFGKSITSIDLIDARLRQDMEFIDFPNSGVELLKNKYFSKPITNIK